MKIPNNKGIPEDVIKYFEKAFSENIVVDRGPNVYAAECSIINIMPQNGTTVRFDKIISSKMGRGTKKKIKESLPKELSVQWEDHTYSVEMFDVDFDRYGFKAYYSRKA